MSNWLYKTLNNLFIQIAPTSLQKLNAVADTFLSKHDYMFRPIFNGIVFIWFLSKVPKGIEKTGTAINESSKKWEKIVHKLIDDHPVEDNNKKAVEKQL